MDKPNKENWTKDQDGNPIDWTKPPYKSESGVLNLLLSGETIDGVRRNVYQKRVTEYYAIIKKRHQEDLERRAAEGEYMPRPGGGIMRKERGKRQ